MELFFVSIFLFVEIRILLRPGFLFHEIPCLNCLELRVGFFCGGIAPFFCDREFLPGLVFLIFFLFLLDCIRDGEILSCLQLCLLLGCFVLWLELLLLMSCEVLRGLGMLLGIFCRMLRLLVLILRSLGKCLGL